MPKKDESIKDELKMYFGDAPLLFLKFSNNVENLKSLQKGNMYMNNLRYFVELEEKSGVAGMGDKLEGLNVMNDVELSFYTPGTDILLGKGKAKLANFRYEDAMYKPVFCLYAITLDKLEIVEHTEKSVKLHFNFSDEEIAQMEKDFGSHIFIVLENVFMEHLSNSFQKNGYEFIAKKAEYLDFSVNEQKRIETYVERNPELFFFKDKKFEHQNEYRIVILNKDEEKAIIENIGSFEGKSLITETKALSKGKGYEIQINFN